MNPIYKKARKLTGIKDFTEWQRKLVYSQQVIRNFVRDYVMQRKSGEVKSQVPEGVDLLSLFLQNQEFFDDELIVDELVGFFLVAVNTTQNTLQTIIALLSKSPDVLQKVRTEFKAVAESYGSEMDGLTKTEICQKVTTMQNIHDFEYLSWVVMETLRI